VSCGEESFGASEGPQRQRAPVFETVEATLDQIAGLVERFAIPVLFLAIFTRRNAGSGFAFSQPVTQVVCVIPTIRDDGCPFPDNRFKALSGMGNIGLVPAGNGDANRPASTIADQVQLAVQPAFRAPDRPPAAGVFFTPFAAIRWVLTWVASIISVRKSALSCASASNIRSNTPASDQRL